MAETPKDGNDTGARETGDSVTGGSVTGSAAPDTVVADTLGGVSEESLDGGAASPADDTLETGPEDPDGIGSTDGKSEDGASDHIEGGEGHDTLSDTSSDTPSASPWSTPAAAAPVAAAGAGRAGNPGASDDPSPAGPAKTIPAKSGGGAGRLVVLLILIVLVAGVGYATYPEWRDEAEPYAQMIGISLPEVPGGDNGAGTETAATRDGAAPPAPVTSTPDGTQPEPDRGSASEPAASQPTGSAQTAAPQTAAPQTAAPQTAPPQPDSGVTAEAFDALVERVAVAEAEIDRLSSAPAPSGGGAEAADSGLADRVESLENKLTALNDEMAIVRQGLGNADDTDGVSEAATALTGRLADLDARLSALEEASDAPEVTEQDLTAVSDRIDATAQAVGEDNAELTARLDALAAAQQDLSDRLSQGRGVQEKAAAFLLASNLLAASVNESGGFSAELDAVEAAALDQPAVADALATLRDHAAGVPSVADLRARFPAVAASVIDASIVGADDGMVGTALTRIAALVTLRRTETDDGDAIDAIVNRAEAAANAGDLPAAVEALSALDGDPAKVATPWVTEAKARIAVNGAVRTLQSRALATLSGG